MRSWVLVMLRRRVEVLMAVSSLRWRCEREDIPLLTASQYL